MPPPWLKGEKRREGENFGQRICNKKVRCNWEHPWRNTLGNLENIIGKLIGNLENILENRLGT